MVTVLPIPTLASANVPVPLVPSVSLPTRLLSDPSAVTASAKPLKVLSSALWPVMVSDLRLIVALLPAPAAVRLGNW